MSYVDRLFVVRDDDTELRVEAYTLDGAGVVELRVVERPGDAEKARLCLSAADARALGAELIASSKRLYKRLERARNRET